MPIDSMELLIPRLDTKFGEIDAAINTKLGPPTDAGTFDPTLIDLSAGQLQYDSYPQTGAIAFALDPGKTPAVGGTVLVNIVGGGFAVTFASPFVGLGGLFSGVKLTAGISYAFGFYHAADWAEVAPGVYADRVLVQADGTLRDLVPETFGAVGDGSTSDTAALDLAIAEAVSTGRRLVGDPSKVYYVGTSLADFTGTLRIADIHFKAPNQVRILRGNPTWTAENTSLTALSTTVLAGTNVTRVALASTTGLAVGDWVMVGSNTIRWPADDQTFWFESAQIVGLNANLNIDLHRRLLGEETGLLNAGLRLFLIPNYRLEADRIRFSVDGNPSATGQTNRQTAIELRGGVGHQLNDISADTWWGRVLNTRASVISQIRGLHWNKLPDITSPSTEALGYGYIDEAAGYGNSVVGMNGGHCRHGYTNGGFGTASYSSATPWQYGMPVNGHCADSLVAGGAHAFDTHDDSIGTTFSNCVAIDQFIQPNSNSGDPGGFQNRGYRTRFVGCSARGGDFGFRDTSGQHDWTSLGGNVSTYENCGANETDQAGLFFNGSALGSTILVNGFTAHGTGYAFQSGASSPFAGTLTAKGVLTANLTGGVYLNGGHTGTVEINAQTRDSGTFVPTAVNLSAADEPGREYDPYTQSGALAFALAAVTEVPGAYITVQFTGNGSAITWSADFAEIQGNALTAGDYAGFTGSRRLVIVWSAAQGKALVALSGEGGGAMTAAELLAALLTVDGTGTGLDADLLDGQHASAFQPIDADLTALAALTSPATTLSTALQPTTAQVIQTATLGSGAVSCNLALGAKFAVTINAAWNAASPLLGTNLPSAGQARTIELVATISGTQTVSLSGLPWLGDEPTLASGDGAVIVLIATWEGSTLVDVVGANRA